MRGCFGVEPETASFLSHKYTGIKKAQGIENKPKALLQLDGLRMFVGDTLNASV